MMLPTTMLYKNPPLCNIVFNIMCIAICLTHQTVISLTSYWRRWPRKQSMLWECMCRYINSNVEKICNLANSLVVDHTALHNVPNIGGPCYLHGLTLIPAWLSNCIPHKVWDEITHPFSNFNGKVISSHTLLECDCISILGSKSIRTRKRGPRWIYFFIMHGL